MDNVPALTKSEIDLGFAESFAYQIALGMLSPREVCQQFGVSKEEWNKLKDTKSFRLAVGQYRKEIDEEGITTRRKAQIAADAGIADMVRLWRDDDQPGSARVKAFEVIANLAGIAKPVAAAPASGFSLTVILDGDTKAERVVNHENPPNIPQVILDE